MLPSQWHNIAASTTWQALLPPPPPALQQAASTTVSSAAAGLHSIAAGKTVGTAENKQQAAQTSPLVRDARYGTRDAIELLAVCLVLNL